MHLELSHPTGAHTEEASAAERQQLPLLDSPFDATHHHHRRSETMIFDDVARFRACVPQLAARAEATFQQRQRPPASPVQSPGNPSEPRGLDPWCVEDIEAATGTRSVAVRAASAREAAGDRSTTPRSSEVRSSLRSDARGLKSILKGGDSAAWLHQSLPSSATALEEDSHWAGGSLSPSSALGPSPEIVPASPGSLTSPRRAQPRSKVFDHGFAALNFKQLSSPPSSAMGQESVGRLPAASALRALSESAPSSPVSSPNGGPQATKASPAASHLGTVPPSLRPADHHRRGSMDTTNRPKLMTQAARLKSPPPLEIQVHLMCVCIDASIVCVIDPGAPKVCVLKDLGSPQGFFSNPLAPFGREVGREAVGMRLWA